MTRGGRVRCHSIRKSGQWPRASYKTLGPRVPQSQDQPLPDNMSALFSPPLIDQTPIVVSVNRVMSWSSFSAFEPIFASKCQFPYHLFFTNTSRLCLNVSFSRSLPLQVFATHPHHLCCCRSSVVPPPSRPLLPLWVDALRPAARRQG